MPSIESATAWMHRELFAHSRNPPGTSETKRWYLPSDLLCNACPPQGRYVGGVAVDAWRCVECGVWNVRMWSVVWSALAAASLLVAGLRAAVNNAQYATRSHQRLTCVYLYLHSALEDGGGRGGRAGGVLTSRCCRFGSERSAPPISPNAIPWRIADT